MKEIDAISKDKRCKQPMNPVSLNPPQDESVRVEVFEHALNMIEERRELQDKTRLTRELEAKQILARYKDAAHYRLMKTGELSVMRESFERGSGRDRGSERGASRGREGSGRGRDKGLDLG